MRRIDGVAFIYCRNSLRFPLQGTEEITVSFKSAEEVVKYIKDNDVEFVDVRFTDVPGIEQHFTIPA